MANNKTVLAVCPQCGSRLEIKRAAEGGLYRQCRRCGWNDLYTGGMKEIGGVTSAEESDDGAPRKKPSGCTAGLLALIILVISAVAALISYLNKSG